MDWEKIDWHALERLRTTFLEGSAGHRDYWQSENDLFSYDQTFAQRIGWKWDYVLVELGRRGWTPPRGVWLDWGCGSGVAHRAFLDHFGAESATTLLLWDRSPLARAFAERRVQQRFPDLQVRARTEPDAPPEVLLLSHVLTELDDQATDELVALARNATAVLWVEPGTYDASRALIAVRERLRTSFNVVAPCTHQVSCGMLEADNAAHWCHHFASPPTEVFTDGHWARFAALAGIDLRSLPLSFLVLDKRPAPELPAGAVRVIGQPRIYKPHALLLGCAASGLHERNLIKRILPDQFRALKKDAIGPLQVWECAGDRIVKVQSC